jgi:hypothetical protein
VSNRETYSIWEVLKSGFLQEILSFAFLPFDELGIASIQAFVFNEGELMPCR